MWVQETSKGLKFPKTIPQPRGNSNSVALAVLLIVVLLIGCCFIENRKYSLYIYESIAAGFFLQSMMHIIYRICLTIEECRHLTSRYNNSFIKLFKTCFQETSLLSATCALSFGYLFSTNPFKTLYDFGCVPIFCTVFASFFGFILFQSDSFIHTSRRFHNQDGLDCGSGYAYSFFHGYLKIVLPPTGNEAKAIEEIMKDYEARHDISFAVYKLFILIPLSCYCPVTLPHLSTKIESSTEMEEKQLDRAGVSKRIYKNSVYKITDDDGKKVYVCAEYATPLRTLYDINDHNILHAESYKTYKKEITLRFFLTLRELLKKNPDCNNVCELIYYNDVDSNGKYHDVGEILLNKINEIQRNGH